MALADVAAPADPDASYTGVVPFGARPIDNHDDRVPPPTEPPTNGRKVKTAPGPTGEQHDWYDPDAELTLAASLMVNRHDIPEALTIVAPTDLSAIGGPLYAAVVDLANSGEPFDAGVLARRCNNPALTHTLDTRVTAAWRSYARHLADLARRRRIGETARLLYAAAVLGDDTALEQARADLDNTVTSTGVDALPHEPLAAFLDSDEPEHDWVIEGLLERGDRVLLTGPEGGGKSTLLRQIAVQAAAGIHPFTLDDIEPLTVVLVDLENSTRFLRRMLRPLDAAAAQQAGDNLHIVSHPQGLDLTDPDDRRAFTALIDQVQPDLLLGGPVYKLVGGDPTEEGPAKAAAGLLDQLRVRHGFALALETHQPHENGGKRPERPYGASLWKRWPEFGLHLADRTYELRHWRGDRDQRAWPAALQRGGEWPWTVASDGTLTFARLCDEVRQAGRMLSLRELGDRLGASKSWVARTIEANRNEWAALESAL